MRILTIFRHAQTPSTKVDGACGALQSEACVERLVHVNATGALRVGALEREHVDGRRECLRLGARRRQRLGAWHVLACGSCARGLHDSGRDGVHAVCDVSDNRH